MTCLAGFVVHADLGNVVSGVPLILARDTSMVGHEWNLGMEWSTTRDLHTHEISSITMIIVIRIYKT